MGSASEQSDASLENRKTVCLSYIDGGFDTSQSYLASQKMFGLGWPELLIVMGVFVLLFGGAKLPGLMRNLGRSVNEFKAGIKEPPTEKNIDAKFEDDYEEEKS